MSQGPKGAGDVPKSERPLDSVIIGDWSPKQLGRNLALGAGQLLLSTLLNAAAIWASILDTANYTGPYYDHTALSFVWLFASFLGAIIFVFMVVSLRPAWTRSPNVYIAYITTASCVYLALLYSALGWAVERAELPIRLHSRAVWGVLGFALMGVLLMWGVLSSPAWEQRKWRSANGRSGRCSAGAAPPSLRSRPCGRDRTFSWEHANRG